MRPIDLTTGEWRLKENLLTPRQAYATLDEARLHLGILVGRYCTFCEMQMSVSADFLVEGALPQAPTTDAKKLFLVCPYCSQYRKQFITPAATIADFIFPVLDQSFDFLIYQLSRKHLQRDLIDAGLLTLLPDSPHTARTLNKSYEQVWVLPNPRYQENQKLYNRIKQTIRVNGLNNFLSDEIDPGGMDRRVQMRTQAWHEAKKFAQMLIDQHAETAAKTVGKERSKKFLQGLIQQIGEIASLTGFWSVWLTVFSQTNFGDPLLREQLICDILIKPFPGTRYRLSNVNCSDDQPSE